MKQLIGIERSFPSRGRAVGMAEVFNTIAHEGILEAFAVVFYGIEEPMVTARSSRCAQNYRIDSGAN